MSEQMGFTETVDLATLDRTGGFWYIDVTFILSGPSAPSFDQLCAGATLASRLYPELSGRLNEESMQIDFHPSGLVQPIPVMNGGKAPFSVDDFRRGELNAPGFFPLQSADTIPSFEVASEKDQKQSENDQKINDKAPNNSPSQAPIPMYSYNMVATEGNGSTVMVKFTQLVDGVVIGISTHHCVYDAHSTGLVAQVLSHCTRLVIKANITNGVSLDSWKYLTNDVDSMVKPVAFETSRALYQTAALYNPIPTPPQSPSSSPKPFNHMFCRVVPKRQPLAMIQDWEREGVQVLSFRFDLSQQILIKKAAEGRALRHGHNSFISTRDAIVGYLFTLYLAATHLFHKKSENVENVDQHIAMAVPLNVRKLIGLPESYGGNAPIITMVEGSLFEDWFNGKGGPALIRQTLLSYTKEHPADYDRVTPDGEIRINPNGNKPTVLRDVLQWLEDLTNGGEPDLVRHQFEYTWSHTSVDGYTDGSATDWTRMGWRGCHFTPQGEEEMQKFLRNTHPSTQTPPMIVTAPFAPNLGHIKLIDDVAGEEGAILAHLYVGAHQMEQLALGGPLHHALADLEWIGKELDYAPVSHSD